MLPGDAIDETDEDGELISGETLLLLFNSGADSVEFPLPERQPGCSWMRLLDTQFQNGGEEKIQDNSNYLLEQRTCAVLRPFATDQ